jgi:hypothetical protein
MVLGMGLKHKLAYGLLIMVLDRDLKLKTSSIADNHVLVMGHKLKLKLPQGLIIRVLVMGLKLKLA